MWVSVQPQVCSLKLRLHPFYWLYAHGRILDLSLCPSVSPSVEVPTPAVLVLPHEIVVGGGQAGTEEAQCSVCLLDWQHQRCWELVRKASSWTHVKPTESEAREGTWNLCFNRESPGIQQLLTKALRTGQHPVTTGCYDSSLSTLILPPPGDRKPFTPLYSQVN